MQEEVKATGAFWKLLTEPKALRERVGSNFELWVNLAVIGGAIVFMAWQGTGFAITVGTLAIIFAILAVSLNLVVGFTGLLSVAHVAFYGVGAYTLAILTTDPAYEQLRAERLPIFGLPFFAALPVAVVVPGLVALIIGGVVSKFRDDLFVLVSFGLAVIAYNVFLNWRPVTRGPFGLHEVARPAIGGWVVDERWEFLVLALGFLALVLLLSWLVVSSSFGRVLQAIREDERAIEVFGYRASLFKLAIWVISAMMAGLAGALLGGWTTYIDPRTFTLLDSILMVTIVILGGLASLRGSLLGALVFVLLNEAMRFVPFLPTEFIGPARQAVLGILIVLLMLLRPQGLIGRYKL